MKGKSSHKLLSGYRHLKKRYWGAAIYGAEVIGFAAVVM